MNEPTQETANQRHDGPATMPAVYEGWWEQQRAHWVRSRVQDLTRRGSLVADVGCGRGWLLGAANLGSITIVNVDSHVWDEWEPRSDVLHVCASADALPFRDGVFDVVGSFDVLEHLPDDQAALREQCRVVRTSGSVVAAMPADRRLWSAHDVAVGHFRRYDVQQLNDLAARSGLQVERSTRFFSYLWLPTWLMRNRPARTAEPGNGKGLLGAAVRWSVGIVAAVERLILRRWSLPFGTSVWAEFVPRHGD